MASDLSGIPESYDEQCHCTYAGGRIDHCPDAVNTFWAQPRSALPRAAFSVDHVIGREDALMPPRAAIRWTLEGRHEGWGASGRPTGMDVYVMGISHVEFGLRGIRREYALYDEVAIWKQILLQSDEARAGPARDRSAMAGRDDAPSLRKLARGRAVKADFRAEKALVRAMHADLAAAPADGAAEVLACHVAPDWHWRGMHPFHERRGAEAVAAAFWTPLMASFTRLQRRPDIFMAGLNEIDGFSSVWVVSMGHLMGLFDRPWLGIRPTWRITMLRYCEFNRVEAGRIVETALFCDIPAVMIQAGQNPFPPQTGAHIVQPGPMTHDGLMWDAQDPAEGQATLRAINTMLSSAGRGYHHPEEARLLAEHWHDDMIWWGPAGIGSTYTIDGFRRQHTGPFDDAFSQGGDGTRPDLCHIAEGRFGAVMGYANMIVRNAGGYLGMTAGPGSADLRVVDVWRREGGKLAENWIFIDLLHYLNQQGLNVLARNAAIASV